MKKNEGIPLALMIAAIFLATISASAESYTLQIYGNANMDETIDDLDIEYVRGIIGGTNEKTDLADANYDGQIDEEDIAQIEQILSGEEKQLTIADNNGRIVAINQPADKVICYYRSPEDLAVIGAKDKIIGADTSYLNRMGEIREGLTQANISNVGTSEEPNYEKILELMPDVIISPLALYNPSLVEEMDAHLPDAIPVAGIDFYLTLGEPRYHNIIMLGYILDKEDEAEELVGWMQGYENALVERTKNLTSEEKPTVLSFNYDGGQVQTTAHGASMIETYAGGHNLAKGFIPEDADLAEVSNEWIVEQDPDVIFVSSPLRWNTSTEDAEAMLKEFIDKPGWDKMSAVVNHRVYLIGMATSINRYIIGACFYAKCIHPELFDDIDPEKVNREYFEKFLGYEPQGVWMYPAAPSS